MLDYCRITRFILGPAIITTLTMPLAAQDARIEQQPIKTHASQGEVAEVDGSAARIFATPEGFFAGVDTQGLQPGHVNTLLLVVINDPSACAASPCGAEDVMVRTDEVQADVGYGDGVIVGEDGTASFAAFQPSGEMSDAWFGNGLSDPTAAEIHLVINDHGPLIPDQAQEMLTTYRSGCTDESIPSVFPDTARAQGTPGPNSCALMQSVIFVPPGAG